MKRTTLCLLTAALLGLTACGGAASSAGDTESITAETTTVTEATTTSAQTVTTTAAETTTTVSETTTTVTEATTTATAAATAASATEDTGGNGMHGERFDETDIIAPGLWLGTRRSGEGDGLRRFDTYYEIHADGTGIMLHQETGLTETFRYTFKDGVLGFIPDSGASMYTADAELYAADGITVTYKFQYGGATEDWQYTGDTKISAMTLFSNARLCEMAKLYYNTRALASGDPVCAYAEAVIDDSDMIEVVLYEQSAKDQPLQTYTVDRATAQGHDWDFEPVDLNHP